MHQRCEPKQRSVLTFRMDVSLIKMFLLKPSSAILDFLWNSKFELEKLNAVSVINIIHVDRFDTFSMFLNDRGYEDSKDFSDETSRKAECKFLAELCFAVSTTDIAATEVCQFQQDRGEQVCQFQKDRDEQARSDFERVLLMNVWIVGYIFASFDMSTADIVAMPVC